MRRAPLTVFALPFILAFVVLSGCATYHAQPVEPDMLASQFEARSLTGDAMRACIARDSGSQASPWPPTRWNRELLTLAAFCESPTLALARAQWHTAKAGIDVAGAIPNPVLQLPFLYNTPNPGPGAPFTYGPSLDIPIETAHKRGYRVDRATHLAQAARFNALAEAWTVRAQVRDAMLALYAAQTRIAILSKKADARRQITIMSRHRLAAGQYAQPDVSAAVLADTQAQGDLAAARSAETDARAQLAAAIGVTVTALNSVTLDLSGFDTPPPAPPAAQVQRAAIFHRADLRASLDDYAAAESALQLEIARQYPDLHLGPGYTYDTGTNKIAFGLAGITLPVFDQNQGGIREAEAKRKEAAARTAALQDRIIGDLAHALARYEAGIESLRIADAHRTSAHRQLAGQAAAYASGEVDRLTYTQAQADYEVSESARLDAEVAVQQAAGALEDAMQQAPGQAAPSQILSEGTTE